MKNPHRSEKHQEPGTRTEDRIVTWSRITQNLATWRQRAKARRQYAAWRDETVRAFMDLIGRPPTRKDDPGLLAQLYTVCSSPGLAAMQLIQISRRFPPQLAPYPEFV